MNLLQLQTSLYGRFGYPSPDAAVTTRFNGFLNQAHREVLGKKWGHKLRRNILTFQSVANSPFAVLPQAAVRVLIIADRVNGWNLRERRIQQIRYDDPQLNAATSYPYEYSIINYAGAVAADPSTADQLYAISDNAADNATKTVFIEGIVTGGYYQKASAALNGFTVVGPLGNLSTWIAVTKFYVALTAGGSTTATGNITLRQSAGVGPELARIPPGRAYPRYTRLQLHPTPTQANTYYADVELHVEDLAQATDEPMLPEDFHDILDFGAGWREYQKREKVNEKGFERGMFDRRIGDMQLWLSKQQGIPLPNMPRQFSQLGPYFPVGS